MAKERILVVDDEEQIVRLERLMLERLGYQITSRVSSLEALQAFKANPYAYDLVITDMTMPHMTGDALAVELLKIRPDLPIILCTGYSSLVSEDQATSMGIKKYLLKPVSRIDLSEAIRDAFR